MNNCPVCNSPILKNTNLIDDMVAPLTNRSRIIYPKCSVCAHILQVSDIEQAISSNRKVLLISGTSGAGKTALGQYIESKSDYLFLDGDAISKRVNRYRKLDPDTAMDCYQKETIRTMLVLLGLGYDIVIGYVINQEYLRWYQEELAPYAIKPVFRVLIPERKVCLQRDIDRDCWTAGPAYVDMWYDEQRAFLKTHPEMCIDSSQETLADTFSNHFLEIL